MLTVGSTPGAWFCTIHHCPYLWVQMRTSHLQGPSKGSCTPPTTAQACLSGQVPTTPPSQQRPPLRQFGCCSHLPPHTHRAQQVSSAQH